MIKHLKVADYRKMLWKNGAGYTVELARSAGESLDTFDWRISMADVTSSGLFSQFDGMQRILTVLEGHGIRLNVDNKFIDLGTLQSAQFLGNSVVSCELVEGAIRDFNLIYRPDLWHARYQWLFESTDSEVFSSADVIFIFNQSSESLEIQIDQQNFCLEHHQSLQIENKKLLRKLVLQQPLLKQACLIELSKI